MHNKVDEFEETIKLNGNDFEVEVSFSYEYEGADVTSVEIEIQDWKGIELTEVIKEYFVPINQALMDKAMEVANEYHKDVISEWEVA